MAGVKPPRPAGPAQGDSASRRPPPGRIPATCRHQPSPQTGNPVSDFRSQASGLRPGLYPIAAAMLADREIKTNREQRQKQLPRSTFFNVVCDKPNMV